MEKAIQDAKGVMWRFRIQTKQMANLLRGELRSVTADDNWSSHEILVKLKRELSQYDAKKRQWKN